MATSDYGYGESTASRTKYNFLTEELEWVNVPGGQRAAERLAEIPPDEHTVMRAAGLFVRF